MNDDLVKKGIEEAIQEILRNPAVLKTPEGEFDDDTAVKWAWFAHGYDTGMEPFYSADQLRSALETAIREHLGEAQGEKWMPIDSAPKDGTNVLLSDGNYVSQGGWVTDLDHGADWEGQIGMAGWWHIDGDGSHPTHWQPMPPAPTEKE